MKDLKQEIIHKVNLISLPQIKNETCIITILGVIIQVRRFISLFG